MTVGTGLPEDWDKRFNPSRYDAEGNLTASARQQDAQMGLASSGGGGGGGNGTHKASKEPWTAAGGVADDLRSSVSEGINQLKKAHENVTKGTSGFSSAKALADILGSWEGRLQKVKAECDGLSSSLKQTGIDFSENDKQVKGTFASGKGGK
ncbi:hypothetical protein [Streptomyces netropsis]|uniref:Type IV secretory pathway TrbL component n=1 Tax=Streptomyces netropsis TaxID=55404 RepID=A0A7W7L6I0_STRNE|nr:hypothetical protein [Streptomyces netropsis]MBB4884008.1 type IV secretory pathway TrbL component [Streptomyces netropsis]GGR06770.1 hypothetical protein GCM10010219_09080 [Streptomyces netropsis]